MVASQNYNFLGSYNSQGVPDYLEENDVISQETMDLIHNSLPESYPVPDYNPQYISSGYDTDLILIDSAAVYVTFLEEGAGYKNVLGFYTYDVNNIPETGPEPEDITIIFPNVSRSGSGGGLIEGNKVKIGDFAADIGIGWVLLANGWNGSVTSGLWQLFSNPDYNPEADEDLRHHNVLLMDDENERIILGFEDIRRDYSSCDNDFNDAVFYVTANPYEAIQTNNFANINDATNVTSGNNGGLESNDNLAKLIAKRNFNRSKNKTALNKKELQKAYKKSSFSRTMSSSKLDNYFPETAMYGSEIAHVSSPDDLLGITNADAVFSVDYYEKDKRIAAALATETIGTVYDHSKVICDRLNNSNLKDVRTVKIRGHKIIISIIKRQNGEIEYTLSFSIKKEANANKVYSLWNIGDYPSGNYSNFQIWGGSMSQVSTIANHIFDTFKAEKTLENDAAENKIPNVFIKNGIYKNGKLELNIINKSKSKWINFEGSLSTSEISERENVNYNHSLSGEWEESITINTGALFDIGLSVLGENSKQYDALYLADGPWGVDYQEESVIVDAFNIKEDNQIDYKNGYLVERDVAVYGAVKGTMNLFRNILSGEMALDVNEYRAVSFTLKNSKPIEVVLVIDNLVDWNNRLRLSIEPNTSNKEHSILFSDFKDGSGNTQNIEKIRSIVFSVQGDYQIFSNFELEVSNLSFDYDVVAKIIEEETITQEEIEEETRVNIINYPNPFRNYTTIKLPVQTEYINLLVVDMLGRTITHTKYKTKGDLKSVEYEAFGLTSGVYKYIATDSYGKKYPGSFLVN